jgi:glycosyltransferase involved in cell wall biosynthesis
VLTSPSPWRRLAQERDNHHRLREALHRHRPDVVSVWNMGALSLGLLQPLVESGIPLVYVVCDDWLIYAPRLDAWTRMFRERAALGRAVSVVTRVPTRLPDIGASGTFCFVSQTTRTRAEESSDWEYPDATVVYSGIDLRDFPPSEVRDRPWDGRLLYVGRVDDRKGIDTAVRALVQLGPPVSLDIVGKGDDAYLEQMRELVRSLDLDGRVRFSSAPRAELADRYRSADAFVFPSTWAEPFGLVPVEAMACATPVVATGTGGSGEFLADGVNCVLFAAGDSDALAQAIRRLAGDPGLRRRIAEGGLRTAAALTVDRLADVLEDWHVAAAGRFADGRPAHRPAPSVAASHG